MTCDYGRSVALGQDALKGLCELWKRPESASAPNNACFRAMSWDTSQVALVTWRKLFWETNEPDKNLRDVKNAGKKFFNFYLLNNGLWRVNAKLDVTLKYLANRAKKG